MNLPHSKNFQTSSAALKPTTLSRRSATFLYPSDIKESATTKLLNYSLKARRKPGHSVAFRGENNDLAFKVVRSPYSLKIKEHSCLVKGVQSRKTPHELQRDKCPSPFKNEHDSKENEYPGECNQGSPILRSRRFRRKAMKKSRLSTSAKKSAANNEQSNAQVPADTGYDTPKSPVCEVDRNGGSEHNSNEFSSIDFSKIFSECFSQDQAVPVQANATNITVTNCGVSEMNEIAPAISNNDANNTFDSTFSCTDEELLACVCDDFDKPQPVDVSSKQGPGNSSSVKTFTNLSARPDMNFQSNVAVQLGGNESGAPVFGFTTASKKEIKISKTALLKAENLLCYDCFGDPL